VFEQYICNLFNIWTLTGVCMSRLSIFFTKQPSIPENVSQSCPLLHCLIHSLTTCITNISDRLCAPILFCKIEHNIITYLNALIVLLANIYNGIIHTMYINVSKAFYFYKRSILSGFFKGCSPSYEYWQVLEWVRHTRLNWNLAFVLHSKK
jgi:hypothetical protein